MQNDKSRFKIEFKKRLYTFTLKLIEFLDKLPKDNVSRRIGDQLLRHFDSEREKIILIENNFDILYVILLFNL